MEAEEAAGQAVGGGERGPSCFWALAFPLTAERRTAEEMICALHQRCADPPPDHATHTAANAAANFSGV